MNRRKVFGLAAIAPLAVYSQSQSIATLGVVVIYILTTIFGG